MTKGDIVLIPFPFSDFSGNKVRPALILFVSEDDITVCFLSTKFNRQTEFDLEIEPSEFNGLKKVSLLRLDKFATIEKELVIGRLGTLERKYITLMNQNLKKIFQLER